MSKTLYFCMVQIISSSVSCMSKEDSDVMTSSLCRHVSARRGWQEGMRYVESRMGSMLAVMCSAFVESVRIGHDQNGTGK